MRGGMEGFLAQARLADVLRIVDEVGNDNADWENCVRAVRARIEKEARARPGWLG